MRAVNDLPRAGLFIGPKMEDLPLVIVRETSPEDVQAEVWYFVVIQLDLLGRWYEEGFAVADENSSSIKVNQRFSRQSH